MQFRSKSVRFLEQNVSSYKLWVLVYRPIGLIKICSLLEPFLKRNIFSETQENNTYYGYEVL